MHFHTFPEYIYNSFCLSVPQNQMCPWKVWCVWSILSRMISLMLCHWWDIIVHTVPPRLKEKTYYSTLDTNS